MDLQGKSIWEQEGYLVNHLVMLIQGLE